MIKIFLVEDDDFVRKDLRDNIMWQQQGYQFVGEAGDGEMALPMIRKAKPDVLITDITMPFMDGLALSEIVRQEFPQIKIVIISGHSDFESARRAIGIGVEQYLLKPVTRSVMQKSLQEIREKISKEQAREDNLEKLKIDLQEYEQFSKRNFFEKVFEGQLSVREIYEEAQKLSLEIDAESYNLAMVSLWEKRDKGEYSGNARLLAGKREELIRYFQRYPEFLVFRWSLNTYGILIKGEERQMDELKTKCEGNIIRICSGHDAEMEWYLAIGESVGRLSHLPQAYSKVNYMMSYRFLKPNEHILTMENISDSSEKEEENFLENVDIAKADPEIIRNFLIRGQIDEIKEFVDSYLGVHVEMLKNRKFRDYMLFSVYFTTITFMEKFGYSRNELLEIFDAEKTYALSTGTGDINPYMQELMYQAVKLREKAVDSRRGKIVRKALDYIEENFAEESISLNEVSGAAEVSPNYFSAAFRQEMGMTFTEYVTGKRMERAKQLLRQTKKNSGDIAIEVGFKDPHYFSYVFKKTQGCTPREYRNGMKA